MATEMMISDFLAALRQVRGQFQWFIGRYGQIKARKPQAYGGEFCPITALAYAKAGALVLRTQYNEAARLLFLPPSAANRIAMAADGEDKDEIRQALLDAVGLAEDVAHD